MDGEQGFQVGDNQSLSCPRSSDVSGSWLDQDLALGQSARTYPSHSRSPREEGPHTLSREPSRGAHSYIYIYVCIHSRDEQVSICEVLGAVPGTGWLLRKCRTLSFIHAFSQSQGCLHNSGCVTHTYGGALIISSRNPGPGPGPSGFTEE